MGRISPDQERRLLEILFLVPPILYLWGGSSFLYMGAKSLLRWGTPIGGVEDIIRVGTLFFISAVIWVKWRSAILSFLLKGEGDG